MNDILRVRMFAGPNGSGKSTIKSVLRPELLGVYINPDEIEKETSERHFLDLNLLPLMTLSSTSLAYKIGFVSVVILFHSTK